MKTILVLTDFSEHSKYAAEYAMNAASYYKANILLYNAYYIPNAMTVDSGMYQPYYGDYEEFEKESILKLKVLAEELNNMTSVVEGGYFPEIEWMNDLGKVGDTIGELLLKKSIWMVIMGEKSNTAVNHFFTGSDSDQIIEHASSPVLLVPEKVKFNPFSIVTLASSSFDRDDIYAMNFISDLIVETNAEIRILHVDSEENESTKGGEVTKVPTNIFNKNISYYTLKNGNVEKALINYIQTEKSDLFVLVHKKHSFLEGLFHRSVIKRMTDNHKVPTLIFNP